MKNCPLREDKPCIDDVCSSYGDDECPWPPPMPDLVNSIRGDSTWLNADRIEKAILGTGAP